MRLNDFLEMIWELYPKGAAWIREPGLLNKVNTSIAAELEAVNHRTNKLIDEADPRTTFEMLEDWEFNYGLPDECTPLGATLKQRRNSLVAKINFLGDMRPAAYKSIASELNYDVDLVEWRPFICGASECGSIDMIGNEDIRFVWNLDIYGVAQSFFESGVSICGDPLGSWDDADELICRINKQKPSHTKVFYFYKEAREHEVH